MKVDEFVRRLKTLIDEHEDSKFVFFLGAGCSISSGIAGAASLVRSWLPKLKKMKTGSNDNFTSWLTETFPEYTEETASLFYGKVIEELFLLSEQRQREVERLTEGKDPGFGYAVLAQLMTHLSCGSHCNVVLTVNFDDLIADALYLYTQKKPLVISHEFLAGFVRVTRTRPLVIKLHGDARLEPKNTEEETEILPEAVRKVLKNILCEMGIIFIGYGGNDQSIAEILEELPPHSVPWGIYWIGSKVPEGRMEKWLEEKNAVWIKQNDFDELMLLILNEFDLSHPEKDRFDKLYNTYFETFKKLKERIDAQPEEEVKPSKIALEKAVKEFRSWSAVVFEAEKYEKEDPEKAESIYREGLKKFPDNINLLESYANFLYEIQKDYDQAEDYYKKVLKINPEDIDAHINYALLLENMNRYKEAEFHFKEALRIDPEAADAHNNYALLLRDMNRYKEAEFHFKEALRIDPEAADAHNNYALLLWDMNRYDETEYHFKEALRFNSEFTELHNNYALFLENMKKFEEAESHYKDALRMNSDNDSAHNNYAVLLRDMNRYKEAEFHFKEALRINNDDVDTHDNYAVLFQNMKKFKEAESHFKEALRIDSEDAKTHNNYALFLRDMNRYKEAESHFKEALRIDSEDAKTHNNYANLLQVMKKFKEAESHFKEALRIDSDHAEIYNNYALLLWDMNRYKEAESHFKEALRIDPDYTDIIGNYAGFLLTQGNKKGFSFLQKAIGKIREDQSQKMLLLECLFYQYAHSTDKTTQKESLKEIKSLLQEGITSFGWNLSHHVDRARKDGHPHIDFLEKLSKVISEEIDMQELDNFKVWQSI